MTPERARDLADTIKSIMEEFIGNKPGSLQKISDIDELLDSGVKFIVISNKLSISNE